LIQRDKKKKCFWFVLSSRTWDMFLSSYEITLSKGPITIFISQPLSGHGNFKAMQLFLNIGFG